MNGNLGKPNPRGARPQIVVDIAQLVGADVELRCVGGQVYRGELRAVNPDFYQLTRATTCRQMLVARDHVVCIVDERAPGIPPSPPPAGLDEEV